MPRPITGSKQHEKYRAYLAAVFSESAHDALRNRLNELTVAPPYRLRLAVVYCRDSVTDTLTRQSPKGTVNRLSASAVGYTYRVQALSRAGHLLPFAILPTDQDAVVAVVSVCPRRAWHEFSRALRRAYPRVVPIFLSQRELLEGIAFLRKQERGAYELRVRELSARERIPSRLGRLTRSIREWTDEEYEQALALVEERGQTITSMTLEFFRLAHEHADILPTARCRVTKNSQIELTGRFAVAWSTLVSHVAAVGSRKLASFSHRGMRENNFVAAPLAIRYGEPVFDRTSEARRLVQVLGRYPHSMHAVRHGNPYVSVEIADAYDGSAFDVWALSPTRITVVPRLKATEAAVGRLVQYIFEHFREGRIEEHVE